jgi:antitoxin component of MazEF toxin-antitoxin module
LIAYFCYLQSVHREQTDRFQAKEGTGEFRPTRNEKGSNSVKRPNYTLEDLLDQISEDSTNSKKANATPFGPPRKEKGSYPLKRPNYTLKDLLDQITEDNLHDEVDAGPPVGNEVW